VELNRKMYYIKIDMYLFDMQAPMEFEKHFNAQITIYLIIACYASHNNIRMTCYELSDGM
jgi:hypothetical protein